MAVDEIARTPGRIADSGRDLANPDANSQPTNHASEMAPLLVLCGLSIVLCLWAAAKTAVSVAT